MVTERNHTVDFLKCICIAGVVLHHCSNRRLLPEVQNIFSYAAYLTDWCVIAFIGLSGFLEGKRLAPDKDLKFFIVRDCKRLLVPFVLLSVLYSGLFQIADLCGFALRSSVSSTFTGKLLDTLLCRESGIAEQLYFLPLLLTIRIACLFTTRILPYLFVITTGYIMWSVDEVQLTGFSQVTCSLGLLAYILGLTASKNVNLALVVALIAGISIGVKGHNWQILIALLLSTTVPLCTINVPFCNMIGSAAGSIFAYHTPLLLQSSLVAISRIHGITVQLVATIVAVSLISICIAFTRRLIIGHANNFTRIFLF